MFSIMCPACESTDRFIVKAEALVIVNRDANLSEPVADADMWWPPYAEMTCKACGYATRYEEFEVWGEGYEPWRGGWRPTK